MNFWLYVALECGLLALIVIAVIVAFREATSEEPGEDTENEPS